MQQITSEIWVLFCTGDLKQFKIYFKKFSRHFKTALLQNNWEQLRKTKIKKNLVFYFSACLETEPEVRDFLFPTGKNLMQQLFKKGKTREHLLLFMSQLNLPIKV